jgi:hypothetical protein
VTASHSLAGIDVVDQPATEAVNHRIPAEVVTLKFCRIDILDQPGNEIGMALDAVVVEGHVTTDLLVHDRVRLGAGGDWGVRVDSGREIDSSSVRHQVISDSRVAIERMLVHPFGLGRDGLAQAHLDVFRCAPRKVRDDHRVVDGVGDLVEGYRDLHEHNTAVSVVATRCHLATRGNVGDARPELVDDHDPFIGVGIRGKSVKFGGKGHVPELGT